MKSIFELVESSTELPRQPFRNWQVVQQHTLLLPPGPGQVLGTSALHHLVEVKQLDHFGGGWVVNGVQAFPLGPSKWQSLTLRDVERPWNGIFQIM